MLLKICLGLALIAAATGNAIKYSEPHKKEVFRREDIVPLDDDCGDPGYLPFFSVTWFAHVILVEWRAPTDATCTGGFRVHLNDDISVVPYDSSIDIYSSLYENLEGCTEFFAGVRAIGLDGSNGIYFNNISVTTLSPFFPGRIGDISYEFSDDSWVISWEPPYLEGNCIDFYDLYIWDAEYENPISDRVSNTEFLMTPYIPCKSYGLRIIPFMGILGGTQVSDLVDLPARALAPPTPVDVILGNPVANIIFRLEPYESNMCHVSYLSISCTNSNGTAFGFNQLYADSQSRPDVEVAIQDLPSDTYDCQASVTIDSGLSSGFGNSITFPIE